MKLYLKDEKTHLNDALTMVFYEDLKDHCAMLKKVRILLQKQFHPHCTLVCISVNSCMFFSLLPLFPVIFVRFV